VGHEVAVKKLQRAMLEQVVDGLAEPLFVVRVDHPDWPVVFQNAAFVTLSGQIDALKRPLADLVEQMLGREIAVEISEVIRGAQDATIAVEMHGREYLLVLKPLPSAHDSVPRHYAAYWRMVTSVGHAADSEMQQALLKAKRRIRDLSRDDPTTGLLNARSFREVLEHDWAVALREQASLALVAFTIDDFPAYLEVFGQHSGNSCRRRVAQAVRRCLRRASDVAASIDVEDSDNGHYIVVLAHSSEEQGVDDFAARISEAVRELGLHHPRSGESGFVTVSYQTVVEIPGVTVSSAEEFLAQVLESP